jgi:hypothetical protein
LPSAPSKIPVSKTVNVLAVIVMAVCHGSKDELLHGHWDEPNGIGCEELLKSVELRSMLFRFRT